MDGGNAPIADNVQRSRSNGGTVVFVALPANNNVQSGHAAPHHELPGSGSLAPPPISANVSSIKPNWMV
jgi:hypothetical protein